jgi:hypothetical protein
MGQQLYTSGEWTFPCHWAITRLKLMAMNNDDETPEDGESDNVEDAEFLGRPESRDVYLLGAGFSRALSPSMPLVSQLSQAVSGFATSYGGPIQTSGLDTGIGKLIQRNFEEALSYLAEQKPWLEESENQKDKVLLLELTRNIRVAIGRCQSNARERINSGQCEWIFPLFEHWHRSRSVVITLNYDTLVEEIVEKIGTVKYAGLPHPTLPNTFTADPRSYLRVCNIHPPILRDAWLGSTGSTFVDSFCNQPSFRLLKLHGSVNWFRSPNPSAQSDTISYIPAIETATYPGQASPSWIADKAPYIVPPVPNKGSLVYHDSLRAIWREAAEAVKWAKRIVVLGYSMPENDTLLIQLIRGNLFNTKPPIELVNPDKKLRKKVEEIFKGEESLVAHRFRGDGCVKSFVKRKGYLPENIAQ